MKNKNTFRKQFWSKFWRNHPRIIIILPGTFLAAIMINLFEEITK